MGGGDYSASGDMPRLSPLSKNNNRLLIGVLKCCQLNSGFNVFSCNIVNNFRKYLLIEAKEHKKRSVLLKYKSYCFYFLHR